MQSTKNRIRFYLICCTLAASAAISASIWFHAQGPLIVDASEISISRSGERVYQNEPFTGEAVSYHASGQLASADQFLNGRREGYAKKWFEDGLLGYESNYVSGVREGLSRSWWSNGNPRSENYFVSGKVDGVGWRWYRSGTKFKRFNYIAGQPSGVQQAWRENGKLLTNFEYKNGRVYGLRKANTCVGLEDEVLSVGYYESQDG